MRYQSRTLWHWGGAVLALAFAVGCTEGNLLENGKPEGPSPVATGTSGSLSVNLDQFANGTTKNAPQWQNGDLNGNNSAYPPDGSVPFRLSVDGLSPGTNNIHINYDWTAGGHHAYDFLATVDAFIKSLNVCVPNGGNGAVPSPWCQKIGTAYSLKADALTHADQETFGADIFANDGGTAAGASAASTQVTASQIGPTLTGGSSDAHSLILIGGTIVSISDPSTGHAGNVNGNSTGDVLVTFNIPTTTCSVKPCAVLLLWSGHLADDQGSNAYWNQLASGGSADGVSTISGAPWHMRTLNMTTDIGTPQVKVQGSKNQDRSIQPSAIVVEVPTLSITKTPATQTVQAGASFSWTVTLTNDGPGTAPGATINDPLPAITGVTYTVGSGSDATCAISSGTLTCGPKDLAENATLVAVINASTTAGSGCSTTAYTNTATGAATGVTSVQASADVTIQCPSLSLTKTPATQTVNSGSGFSWTVTLHNAGPGSASNAQFTDPLPAITGVTYTLDATKSDASCSLTGGTSLECGKVTLASGGDLIAVINATTTSQEGCDKFTNTATANADGVSDITKSADVTIQCAALTLSKTPATQTKTAGQSFTWTVTLHNNGPGDATNAQFTDPLPTITGVTYALDASSDASCSLTGGTSLECGKVTLASGGDLIAVINATTTAGTGCGLYTNTATANADGISDFTASADVTLGGCTKGQILPTASTCSSFTSGDPSLLNLFATIVQGKVNSVSPGVWFYFLSVIAPSTSFTVNIRESNNGGLPNFQINNGQVNVYTAACATFNGDVVSLVTSADPTGADVAFSGATAGAKYIIGVKYQAGQTLDGVLGASIPQAGVTYTYTTQINGGSVITDNNASVILKKK